MERPGGFPCNDTTTSLTSPVTTVNQCNYSITGAGNVIRCSVCHDFCVSPGATPVSVWQCDGSGASGVVGVNIHCNPFPATTSGAAITQCNGSANGGTLVTPEGLTCVATGTMASALAVTINQCNNSANGGGEVVNCSANMTNNVGTATVATTLSPPGPVSISTTVSDRATLTGVTATAGGDVHYYLYSDNACTNLVQDLGDKTVTNAVAPASSSYTFASAGRSTSTLSTAATRTTPARSPAAAPRSRSPPQPTSRPWPRPCRHRAR